MQHLQMTPPRCQVVSALMSACAAMVMGSTTQAQQPAWTVETHTGPVRELAFDATEGTWMSVDVAPDGTTIAFDLLGTIYEMPVAGGDAVALTSGRSWNLSPRYSPDGATIAFSSDRSGSHQIWVLERTSGEVVPVSDWTDVNLHRPSWSADGDRILASAVGDGVPNQLVALDLDGGMASLISGNGPVNGARPLPGTGRFLFEHLNRAPYPFGFNPYVIPPGGARIESYDGSTGATQVVIERPGGAFQPTPSPDGAHLAYLHRAMQGTVLILMETATREERVLLTGLDRDRQDSRSAYGPYPNLAWYPDGSAILIGHQGGLVRVDTTGDVQPVPFSAPVRRQMSETIRFTTEIPEENDRTRTHRWGQRTSHGIISESLGDLWLHDANGTRNLTRSAAHETSPVVDPNTGALYFASWTDDVLGSVHRLDSPTTESTSRAATDQLTTVASQYGSLALSPDGTEIAFVRGTGGLQRGLWLSNQVHFELVVRGPDGEDRLTGIAGQPLEYANIAGKIPPNIVFSPDGQTIYYTTWEDGILVLKNIARDGTGSRTLYRFPHSVAAVPSPDLEWIALREYHRSFITPFDPTDSPITVSPFEQQGRTWRVDANDGGYLTWSPDGSTLAWTRGSGFYEKSVEAILAGAEAGSEARRTELGIEYDVARAAGTVALTGARVVTMNGEREVLDNATVVARDGRIVAVGRDVAVPDGAQVFDAAGKTIIPGLIDAHAHPHIEHSSLHVIEQAPAYLSGPVAYGVTTMVEVYGNEYRDGWVTDMVRSGRMTGPRFFTTGSIIYGRRHGGRLRMYRPIETLDDAREQVRWNLDHGAIAVKDYAQATRKRRHLVATAAREMGLNVLSESSSDPQMNLTQILDGVTTIEHSMGLAPFHDDVVRFWRGTEAGMTPTLVVVYNGPMGEGWFHQASKLWEDPKLANFIDPMSLMRIRRTTHLWPDDMYAWEMASELRKLYDAGTSMHLGAHGQMVGLGTHWELELFAGGGFPPEQILEIATIRGAEQHGLDARIGSLEVGKLADLVVLDANPLEDISNAAAVRLVMKGGVVYSGEDASRVWPDPSPAPKPYFVREGR